MGISDLEETARRTKDNQRKAELLSQLRELEDNTENNNDGNRITEFERGGKIIIDKMHSPQNLHDKQIHTKLPMRILTNLMMMDGIEEGLRKLIYCDDLKVDGNNVVLYRKINPKDPMSNTNRFKYKVMTYQAYRRAIFYAEAMQGFSGNLLELLMSVDGWRSEQAVTELGSVANTESRNIAGQQETGWLKRQINKLV